MLILTAEAAAYHAADYCENTNTAGLALLTCQSARVATPSQAPTTKIVEASEFILKDGNGNVRARLRMYVPGPYPTGDGPVPQLEMLDEKVPCELSFLAQPDPLAGGT